MAGAPPASSAAMAMRWGQPGQAMTYTSHHAAKVLRDTLQARSQTPEHNDGREPDLGWNVPRVSVIGQQPT